MIMMHKVVLSVWYSWCTVRSCCQGALNPHCKVCNPVLITVLQLHTRCLRAHLQKNAQVCRVVSGPLCKATGTYAGECDTAVSAFANLGHNVGGEGSYTTSAKTAGPAGVASRLNAQRWMTHSVPPKYPVVHSYSGYEQWHRYRGEVPTLGQCILCIMHACVGHAMGLETATSLELPSSLLFEQPT
jgi:hypothetical protein